MLPRIGEQGESRELTVGASQGLRKAIRGVNKIAKPTGRVPAQGTEFSAGHVLMLQEEKVEQEDSMTSCRRKPQAAVAGAM